MAKRTLHKLSDREAKTITASGRHADGGNLYLFIQESKKGTHRRWIFRYRVRGTEPRFVDGEKMLAPIRELGLGPAPGPHKAGLSLADARTKAEELRRMIFMGKDPLAEKRAAQATSTSRRFGDYADEYIQTRLGNFKNDKHRAQWKVTLESQVGSLRQKLIREITATDIERVLKPIAERTPETATRVRGRIERVFNAAMAEGLYSGENPARLKGNLDERVFRKTPKPKRGNHPAIAYAEMPGFMGELRKLESISAKALEFTILAAARTNETTGASWPEINLGAGTWTVPAERMKAGKEHIVPLPARALEILRKLAKGRRSDTGYVFPGMKLDSALSNMAMLQCLRGLRPTGATVHGFRSTFRDWAGDQTQAEREVVEFALAHGITDKTERAYRRGTAIDKRRKLMEAWDGYLAGGKVIPLTKEKVK